MFWRPRAGAWALAIVYLPWTLMFGVEVDDQPTGPEHADLMLHLCVGVVQITVSYDHKVAR